MSADPSEELIDYEEDEALQVSAPSTSIAATEKKDGPVKKGYVGIHSTGFRDFLLKPELLRAIGDCGFEHPSEGKEKRVNCRNTYSLYSPTRMYSSSYFGYGRFMSS